MHKDGFTFPLTFFFFLSGLGILLFFLPFSHALSALFFTHLSLFSLLGLSLFLMGVFFLLAFFSSPFQNAKTLQIDPAYELGLPLIRDSLFRYLGKLYPEKKIEIEVFLVRKKRLEIVFHCDPGDEEKEFLQELKAEVKKFLSERFDYHRTFFLTISPP